MADLLKDIEKIRPNKHGSDDIFRNRWSPRAMTGEDIGDGDLEAMFEAAHWAPSSYNNQPWRFVYVKRGHTRWEAFLDLLVDANKAWCQHAAVLVVVISKTTFDHNGKPMKTHSFDTGAAWGMMALEGARRGLVVHGMQGFDYPRAAELINLPEGYEIEMMAAVGVLGKRSSLSKEMAEREKPSDRKDLSQLAAPVVFTEKIR